MPWPGLKDSVAKYGHVVGHIILSLGESINSSHLGLHGESVLAELAAPDVGGLDPALQAVLVHVLERARAEAGGDERHAHLAAAVADLVRQSM